MFYIDDEVSRVSFTDETGVRVVMTRYWPLGTNGKFAIRFANLAAEIKKIEAGRWFPTEDWIKEENENWSGEGLYYTPKSIDYLD